MSYMESLDRDAKDRYKQKLTIIGGVDPYTLDNNLFSTEPEKLPGITYPDIVNYLVYRPSPITLEDLKSYRGLEAYNQFVNGFVRGVRASVINGYHLVVGQVMHSQRLRDVPLKPWVIAESQGNVVSGHCNCMAGLGETCTHVSALLFHVETTVRIRDSRTVTEEAAYWKLPTNGKEKAITYAPVAEIDFSSAKAKKRKIDSLIENDKVSSSSAKTSRDIPEPTAGEMSSFYGDLVSVGSKAAVLSIVPEHCSAFVPTVLQEKYPSGLTELYDSSKADMTFIDLLSLCNDVNISVTLQQAKYVEEATKMQAASKNWFYFRAGRITASKMKRVCRSNPDQPSISLVNEIYYPSNKIFATQATKWGCVHEETARKVYLEQMQSHHSNFQVAPSGFLISPDHPHIGASPDGKISCDCCGEGLLEVKCPFCAKDCTMEEYVTGSGACLYQENGQFFVKKDHQYMFQVQTQLNVWKVDYLDFVVWTTKDFHEPDLDMWTDICHKSEEFFRKAVLPELIGKFYTGKKILCEALDHHNSEKSGEQLYCYCNGPEDQDDMIACDDENCSITWFHVECLKIKRIPKGKWFCPECRKSRNKKTAY